MEGRSGDHPSAEVLKAFAQGALDDASASAVATHLENCTFCPKPAAKANGKAAKSRSPDAKAAEVPESAPELAGSTQHVFVRRVGGGGMGVVYLARNKLMDRLEVLKVVKKAYLQKAGAEERFLREIRSAAKLNHENVVTAYNAAQVGDSMVFAMEYVEGEDLAKVVKEHGPLPVANACFYAYQAALGLQHACEHGVFHRDIKPSNLILARQGKKHVVKILDFGLAKAARVSEQPDSDLTAAGTILGTPAYMAPEQMQDAATVDIRADIYSLGCTLYYLLTGHPPFRGKSVFETMQAHHTKEAVPLDKACPGVPPELAAVVAKMMAKDPAKRFQKPAEAAQALAPFIKSGAKAAGVQDTMIAKTVVATRRDLASSVSGPKRPFLRTKPRWLIGGAAAAGVLFVSLAVLWASGVFTAKPRDGTIVLKDLPASTEVFIDNDKTTVTHGEGLQDIHLSLPPGLHSVELKKKGVTFQSQDVTLQDGGNIIVAVRFDKVVEPPAKAPSEPPKTTSAAPSTPAKEDTPAKKTPSNTSPPQFFKTEDGFVSLFNGQDLSGWTTYPGSPGNWQVKNGAIVGSALQASLLFTQRGDFANFHFRIEAKISGQGNFGQCFRIQDSLDTLKAYEAHITSLGAGFLRMANPDGIVQAPQTKVKPDTWFVQEVMVQGNHIQIFISGKRTADYVDAKNSYAKGHLGIRQLDPNQDKSGKPYPSIIELRRVEVKELSSVAALPPGAKTNPPTAKTLPEEDVLKVQRAKLGPTHADTVKTMFSLVETYSSAGRWNDAIAMCQEVISIRKSVNGEDGAATLTAVSKLGQVFEEAGRMDEAIATLQDLVQRETAKLGRDKAKTLSSDVSLAVAYRNANRLDEAFAVYQDAYKIAVKSTLGPEHATTLALLQGAGHVLVLQKKFTKAEPILRECLKLREKKDPNTWPRYHTMAVLGASLLGQKKFTEAETRLLKGYDGMKEREAAMTQNRLNKRNLDDAINWIVELYTVTGKLDQAEIWRQKKPKTPPPKGK